MDDRRELPRTFVGPSNPELGVGPRETSRPVRPVHQIAWPGSLRAGRMHGLSLTFSAELLNGCQTRLTPNYIYQTKYQISVPSALANIRSY